jgi:divalent metal cation (Fe/Co/Zn/Cd) transporter
LLVVTGLANIAAQYGTGKMQHAVALVGSSSILILGALIAMSDRNLLIQPQTLVLLVLGLILTVQRIRGLKLQRSASR